MRYVKNEHSEYVSTEKVDLDGSVIKVFNANGYGSCDIEIGCHTMRWSDLDKLKEAIAEAEGLWRKEVEMNKQQKIAEILVESGYSIRYEIDKREHLQHNPPIASIRLKGGIKYMVETNITSDTLEARRQADVVEDWLQENKINLWNDYYTRDDIRSSHQYRLGRVNWCLNKLTEVEDE